jgi:hypothetical protein
MRRLLALLGSVAVAVGLVTVAGVWGTAFEVRYAFVTVVGVLAAVQGLRYAAARRSTTLRTTETGDPERRVAVPTPGASFDDDLAVATGWSPAATRARRDVRDRLQTVAVETMAVRGDCSRETAQRQVETGEWTDDPVAAGFLAAEGSATSFVGRLGLLVRGTSPFVYATRRTVEAIDRRRREGPP